MTEIESGQTKLTVEPDTGAIEIARGFDAPREQVFEAYVDPDRIPDWWEPRRYETIVDEMVAQPGGQWRFISRERLAGLVEKPEPSSGPEVER